VSCAKTAEPIEMPFDVWIPVITWGSHWRNLAHTIEPSMFGGDAAFLSNYFNHLLNLVMAHPTPYTSRSPSANAVAVCAATQRCT